MSDRSIEILLRSNRERTYAPSTAIRRRQSALTIPGAVKSVESIKVGILKALVISVESPHHTRPRLTEDEISLSFALDRATVLVEKLRQDPKERERLRHIEEH